jgi:hypothetical protein
MVCTSGMPRAPHHMRSPAPRDASSTVHDSRSQSRDTRAQAAAPERQTFSGRDDRASQADRGAPRKASNQRIDDKRGAREAAEPPATNESSSVSRQSIVSPDSAVTAQGSLAKENDSTSRTRTPPPVTAVVAVPARPATTSNATSAVSAQPSTDKQPAKPKLVPIVFQPPPDVPRDDGSHHPIFIAPVLN